MVGAVSDCRVAIKAMCDRATSRRLGRSRVSWLHASCHQCRSVGELKVAGGRTLREPSCSGRAPTAVEWVCGPITLDEENQSSATAASPGSVCKAAARIARYRGEVVRRFRMHKLGLQTVVPSLKRTSSRSSPGHPNLALWRVLVAGQTWQAPQLPGRSSL